jgi:hypothetical protein
MSMTYQNKLIDRLVYAADVARGKSVLDIGGQHPMNHDLSHPFGVSYRRIADGATAYEVFDRDRKPGVKFNGDLNTAEGRALLAAALAEYRPQVVLCMEILEHLNYPCEIMDTLADYVQRERGAEVFITLPNNGNWILNALNWHHDHNIALFKTVAMRFVGRSRLGRCAITMYPCAQRYRWYWWLIYVLAFGQPINWAFHIRAETSAASA